MRSVELFSGGGGLALGIERAGFEHVCLVERDPNSCATLRANRPHWRIFAGDVHSFDYGAIVEPIDLLAAGAPCQPFSLGGKHAGQDDRRNLFPEVVRAVREMRPKAFLLENVRGLVRRNFLPYFHYIIAQLSQPTISRRPEEEWFEHHERIVCGKDSQAEYDVWYKVLNAADFGVPQIRHRVIIVGFRRDLAIEWQWPSETHSRHSLIYSQTVHDYWREHGIEAPSAPGRKRQSLPLFGAERWRTVRDALRGLPDPIAQQADCTARQHVYIPGARPYKGHTGSLLDWPSKTLKAGDHGVPGGENTIIDAHGRFRYLTVREAARVQTFPDEWAFSGSRTEAMRQIGNAVPVLLAQHVATSIRGVLDRSNMTANTTMRHRSNRQPIPHHALKSAVR